MSDRTLLGYAVPEHVAAARNHNRIVMHCIECGGQFLDDATDPFVEVHVSQFLVSHAHGQVVEHRPAADSDGGALAQQIEWLLIEFGGIKPKNLAANEIVNRIVEPALDALRTERDLALWLHAEAAWKLDRATYLVGLHLIKSIELQARIDKALAASGGTDDERRIARILRGEDEQPATTPPDRSGRWVNGKLQPFGPGDLDGWQPTHPEAVAGD